MSLPWPLLLEVAAWGLAIVWVGKTVAAIRGLPSIPDLSTLDWDVWPRGTPSLTVVVPARNEAEKLPATLDALLRADYPLVRILVVNDRSEDSTGAVVERYTQGRSGTLDGLHIKHLEDGWLGKTFAMQAALQSCESEYVLFTDADVLFSPSVLRRALAYAEQESADHLVVFPTPLIQARSEGVVLGFFQVLGLWLSRLWKVSSGNSPRDAVGAGAFNLVRREALLALGGWAPQRMVVLEDLALGQRFRAARLRQRVAFAPGLVLVHWAAGAGGLVGVMTKNLFSGMNFNPLLLFIACAGMAALFLLPLAGLFWWRTSLPCLGILCCVGATYRLMAQYSGIDARYGWLYPLGTVALVWALVRSALSAWVKQGVVWRGTYYPLRELRRSNSPFQWEYAARRAKRR